MVDINNPFKLNLDADNIHVYTDNGVYFVMAYREKDLEIGMVRIGWFKTPYLFYEGRDHVFSCRLSLIISVSVVDNIVKVAYTEKDLRGNTIKLSVSGTVASNCEDIINNKWRIK